MRDKLDIMERVMAVLSGADGLEQACDSVFRLLGGLMPLRFLVLGFFQQVRRQAFILSWTDAGGTRRLFRSLPLTDGQQTLADRLDFFRNTPDFFVDSPAHPYAPLYRNAELSLAPPFFTARFFHANVQQGAGTFGFEPGARLPGDALDILRVLKMPFNIYIASQYRLWEMERVNKLVEQDNARLRRQAFGLEQSDIVGAGGGLRQVADTLRQVAPLDVSLLIRGETGTGKEVLARVAHALSRRREGPFVAVNCGAIPPSLIDNELFGHSKGAFTGAGDQYRGRFERASGGTLFLDEVGELPPEAQARLLRVLEERKVERLGGGRAVPVDFRLIAATHRDLQQMIADGRFREDLYYRLAVVTLRPPPLRERRQDIPLLVRHFVDQCAGRFGMVPPDVPPAEMAALCARDWPGNVRELRNAVEEAMALSLSGPLRFRPPAAAGVPLAPPRADAPLAPYDAMMKRYLEDALRRCHGKIQGPRSAAELLGLPANTLRAKLRKYGVPHGREAAARA